VKNFKKKNKKHNQQNIRKIKIKTTIANSKENKFSQFY